ncbi:DMT family transporter [Clostridium sp. CX1]|uniref:DMT family transporter n=1 Tax=Clostridium tanneri TaxID=3037988 RepID=A0ABU4JS35_9CLOT|nr:MULTISPECIES: DMT family transporter [unclassified Clostridium]MCT8978111.1 DMT family transporter [Clostridium sp. CX1]MDW8800962.1 DMT family transporter [Clostridium sp. A1-XYC3]
MSAMFKVILSMAIWGSIGLFVKNIDLPSIETVFLRATIASIFLIVYGFTRKSISKSSSIENSLESQSINKNDDRKKIYILIASGITMAFNWMLLFQSYKYTTISNATLSYYFAPVFVILLSPFILKEKFTKSKFFAVAGAMLGLFLILNNQGVTSSANYNHIKGIIFGLMAAVFYASVVLLNKYIKGLSGYEMTVVQISTAAIVLLPIIIYRNNLHISGLKSLIFILIVGIVHTGIPYLLYFSAMKDLKAQSIAVVSYIDPISAVIFGFVFLKETMTVFQVIGGLLILFSTFFGSKEKKVSESPSETSV